MLADEPSKSASKDMLTAGLGLGGIVYAMTNLNTVFPRADMPRTPTTLLDQALPLFAGIPDIPVKVLMILAVVGIPLLVVAGLTPRWSLRALMVAVIVALLSVSAWASAPTGEFDPVTLAVVVGGLVVVSIAIVVWGTLSAWSWIVAVLSYFGMAGLRSAVYGFVWQEQVAGALTLLVVSGLIALIARETTQPRRGSNHLTQF